MPPFEGCDQDVGHSAADQTAALAQETQRGQFSQVMSDISHDEALLDEPIKCVALPPLFATGHR